MAVLEGILQIRIVNSFDHVVKREMRMNFKTEKVEGASHAEGHQAYLKN